MNNSYNVYYHPNGKPARKTIKAKDLNAAQRKAVKLYGPFVNVVPAKKELIER